MQFLAAKFIIPFVKSTQKQFSTTCVKDASFLQSILIKKKLTVIVGSLIFEECASVRVHIFTSSESFLR